MIESATIQWLVLSGARALLSELRQAIGVAAYEAEKDALKTYLCAYFASGDGDCRQKQGDSIAPMSSQHTAAGGKCLKVRWGLPGSGKSGGLRLAIVVYCDVRLVKLVGAWRRRADPGDDEFEDAFREG